MRKAVWLAALALVAGGAGAAYAHDRDGGNPGTTDVSASATLTRSAVTTTSCTGADGTYQLQRFSATGTISGGQLAGNATLALRWLVNTTKNDGYAVGTLVVRSNNEVQVVARVTGVIEGSTLSGFATGRLANGNTRGALLGTFEATRNNGSVAMRLGANTVPGAAIVFGGTGCPSAGS
jgi:hypothetical protein